MKGERTKGQNDKFDAKKLGKIVEVRGDTGFYKLRDIEKETKTIFIENHNVKYITKQFQAYIYYIISRTFVEIEICI